MLLPSLKLFDCTRQSFKIRDVFSFHSEASPQFICVEVPRLPRDALVEWQVLASPKQKDVTSKAGLL